MAVFKSKLKHHLHRSLPSPLLLKQEAFLYVQRLSGPQHLAALPPISRMISFHLHEFEKGGKPPFLLFSSNPNWEVQSKSVEWTVSGM